MLWPWPANLPFSRKLSFPVLLVFLWITAGLRVSFFSFFAPTTFGTLEIYSHILPRNHFTFSKLPEERALIKKQFSCNVVEHVVDHAESYYFNKNSSFRPKTSWSHNKGTYFTFHTVFLLTHLCDILAVRAQPCFLFRGGSSLGAKFAWSPLAR